MQHQRCFWYGKARKAESWIALGLAKKEKQTDCFGSSKERETTPTALGLAKKEKQRLRLLWV